MASRRTNVKQFRARRIQPAEGTGFPRVNTGNGILPGPKEKGGFYNVIAVNAIDRGAGKFSGSFLSQMQGKVPEDLSDGGLAKVKADVIQLVVDETGTMAKVVYKITEWTPLIMLGRARLFGKRGLCDERPREGVKRG